MIYNLFVDKVYLYHLYMIPIYYWVEKNRRYAKNAYLGIDWDCPVAKSKQIVISMNTT